MLLQIIVPLIALCAISAAKDDKKWVWSDNSRDQSTGRLNFDRDPRYEVFENERPYRPSQLYNENQNYHRPDFRPISRPGGVYGGASSGHYGQGHLSPHYPDGAGTQPEILTGPVPSWVKEGPIKNFDKCKCTEKFNCNTPGFSYGHCDVGKQYCCYSTKKLDQIGGPEPSRPVHSIENGILVGPGGPVDGHGNRRPGGYNRPPRPGGFGLGGGGGSSYGPISNRPVYSHDNGILVGPGGPFDRPSGGRPGGGYGSYGGYGRVKSL